MHVRPAGPGHGIGLRVPHYAQLLDEGISRAEWVEAVAENFVGRGGRPHALLERVRRDAGVLLHGVSLSLGGMDPLDEAYLRDLRALADRVEAALVSDHLCFAGAQGRHGHDLWPLPYSQEAIAHVAARIQRAQDLLGRRIAIENVSSYVAFRESAMPEWEFLAEIASRADCWILLDVNNVVVSATNFGFDPLEYVAGVPAARVAQLHLAGYQDRGAYLFDDHGGPVHERVWALYREVVRRVGRVPTIIEWDQNVPPLATLLEESARARAAEAEALAPRGEAPEAT
jgi:uncharacterized protein (UPF0276 family)